MVKSKSSKLIGTVTLIIVLACLLGFTCELFISHQYGTTYEADSIIAAFAIPSLISLVLGGVFTTAFYFIHVRLEENMKRRFVQVLFTRIVLIFGLITIIFMVFPEFWINLFFSEMKPHALELTSKMFFWTAPVTLFLAISIFLSGLHYVYGNYRLISISVVLFNGVYLVVGVGLTPWFKTYSYALGATFGSIVMVLFLMHYAYHQKLMTLRPAFKSFPGKSSS